MERNLRVKPIKVKGKSFIPYPDKKPKDGVRILILTKDEQIFEGTQVDTGFGREFKDSKFGRTYYQNEIKGWWYLEKAAEKPKENLEINYNKR